MARKIIDIGVVGNDGTGDSIRDSFRKVNDNFRELYGALGIGTKLSFLDLDETPNSFSGEANKVLAVSDEANQVLFKPIIGGDGIAIDLSNDQIRIINTVASVSADGNPRLGGDLKARGGGGQQYRILELPVYNPALQGSLVDGPKSPDEAVSKSYADSKIALGGIDAIDPVTRERNTVFGRMTGPLILSRDPRPEDDEEWGGLVAATKRYVDNAGFGSVINLYVATSGEDARVGVSDSLQGRALSYAYASLEAALKKAEEIVRAAPPEIGPYKKTLTWTNPINLEVNNCYLTGIIQSPDSGTGFDGKPLMSVDRITLASGGFYYRVGDIIRIDPPVAVEGVTQAASLEVLTVNTEPGGLTGPILTFRLLTGGVYVDELPGSTNVPAGISSTTLNGEQASFNITYKVNGVQILDKGGSLSENSPPLTPYVDYGLVSVRVTPVEGDTGTGAFGFADVVNGQIDSITITDGGGNFKQLPTLDVNLPRFRIFTGGRGTDFTGDVTTETAAAKRGRDIREGLYLRGEQSGALAQILAHQGSIDPQGNELFDVDIKYGSFLDGEEISYGDVANTVQVSVLIESGIYYENFPLKVPQNVSIVGDEFRRVIIRPKPGISSSPWAFINFRRDRIIDGNYTATNEDNRAREDVFGYHYLSDANKPVYYKDSDIIPGKFVDKVNNRGFFRAASTLLRLNKEFLQEEVVGWIRNQIQNNREPFSSFTYDENICKRDVGFLVDAMVFDLLYGGSARTISAALKYKSNESGQFAISPTGQLSQTIAAIERLNTVIQYVIKNQPIFTYSAFTQVIDLAYVGESQTVGIPVSVANVSNSIIATVTTAVPHGLDPLADHIVSFSGVGGATEINGRSYFVEVISADQYRLYLDRSRTTGADSRFWGEYTSGGTATPNGGVVRQLIDAIIEVISDSDAVNYPEENDKLDVFLMNDATILRALSIQGHGGFAMVLDPEGQILAKSPYAQEGAVFSKSTGRPTFAGGQFVDGFAGNLKFKITGLINQDLDGNTTRLSISNLQRFPQLPASFIVNDNVYRINYVRDYIYDPEGSTATLVLDETTPWPFDIFQYNESICRRDVGLILDGLGYDIVFGTNFNARKAGLTYRQANAAVVINDQLDLTVRAINVAHIEANELIDSLTPLGAYASLKSIVDSSNVTISSVIRRGATAAPNLNLPNPTGLSTAKANAKDLLLENIEFIREEVVGYLTSTYPSLVFESARCKRDIQYIVEAVCYDLIYGGNSATRDAGLKYYDGVGSATTQQVPAGQLNETSDGVLYAKLLAQAVIQNIDFSTIGTLYTSEPQVYDLSNPSDLTTANEISTFFDNISITILGGPTQAPALVLPTIGSGTYDSSRILVRNTITSGSNILSIQNSVIDFIDANADVYEILMPGNRSMLSNDFTQICDMGYGLITTNGGLAEAVSMFTYYNRISYYSLNGGQIRSVAGSSAHGQYALVAEGSDPLEVPTPVDLYYDFAQGATVYNDGAVFGNATSGLTIFVGAYSYPPRDFSEIEIDHGLDIGIARYPVTSVAIEDGFPTLGGKLIARLNINADSSGLLAGVPDGTKVTLRLATQVVLTGDVVDVATRPSTALKLNENRKNIYRILEFADYFVPSVEIETCTILTGTNTIIQTSTPHGQLPGYLVRFSVSSGGSLPTGLEANEPYWIIDDGFTATTFKVATERNGAPVSTTSAGSGTFSFTPSGLALTNLREGYDYVESTIWARQPYVGGIDTYFIGASSMVTSTQYKIVSLGTTNFTLYGASSNTVGTVFTATGAGVGSGIVAPTSKICTFDDATDKVLKTGHGFNNGDVVRFDSSEIFENGLFGTRVYFVYNKSANDFQVVEYPGSTTPVAISSAGSSYTYVVDLVEGAAGDTTFAVVPLGTTDKQRIVGMVFVFKGEEYTVLQYDDENTTGQQYGRLYVSPALIDSVVNSPSPITLKSAVKKRTEEAQGTLTIRISLTRVTGHDFLEIGTGSYADTNYPNEIYGPPVRIATENLLDTTGELDYSQIVERNEGRCFFVTTDQFGNFSVGPYFRVDQGTGTVTFAASIALSNLDGLGFKRGVPVSEFSTDTSFVDNATDTVPTENATRTYLDRRLGVDHEGANVPDERLIPVGVGGFLPLNGQQKMKGNIDMDQYRVTRLSDPVDPEDAVNLRSVKIANIQDFNFSAVESGSVFTFTGTETNAYPAKIDGDIFVPEDGVTTGVDSTLNKLNVYIKPEIIDNANINPSAAIAQSKLSMKAADTAASAPVTPDQSRLGLVQFKNSEFTLTNGFAELQTATSTTTGVTVEKIQHVAIDNVIGRSSDFVGVTGQGAVRSVPFSHVVNKGGAIKKSQYGENGRTNGFLKRVGSTNTADTDYTTVDGIAPYTSANDTNANGQLVQRSSTGDFGGNNISAWTSYRIQTKKVIDVPPISGTGGTIAFYGPGPLTSGTQKSGLTLGDGDQVTDRVNTYLNENHLFRNQDNTLFAPIRASQVTALTFTSGGSTTSANLTGNFFLTTNSNLTLGTGTLDTQNGTLLSRTLTTGDVATTGSVTGNWSLSAGSIFNASSGTLRSTTLTTGASGTAGTLTGNWSLSNSSTFNASSGVLLSTTLSAGNIGTPGVLTGTWSLSASSVFNASPGTLLSTTLSTGAAGTGGTITGAWNLSASSSINASNGTLTSTTLTTGSAGTSGTLTGNWSMAGSSNLTLGTGQIDARSGVLYSTSLNAGSSGTSGTITGAWSVSGSLSGTSISATNLGGTNGNISTLTTTTLTTGSSSTAGTVTGNWSLSSGSRLQATYADLAEYYEGDKDYEVGTVLIFGGDKEVTISSKESDTRVAGVVTDTPAYVMNSECPGIKICVALQGRIPVKVVGKIQKGDILITSNIQGIAIAAKGDIKVGTMIGKALENYDNDRIGIIQVAVGRT